LPFFLLPLPPPSFGEAPRNSSLFLFFSFICLWNVQRETDRSDRVFLPLSLFFLSLFRKEARTLRGGHPPPLSSFFSSGWEKRRASSPFSFLSFSQAANEKGHPFPPFGCNVFLFFPSFQAAKKAPAHKYLFSFFFFQVLLRCVIVESGACPALLSFSSFLPPFPFSFLSRQAHDRSRTERIRVPVLLSKCLFFPLSFLSPLRGALRGNRKR